MDSLFKTGKSGTQWYFVIPGTFTIPWLKYCSSSTGSDLPKIEHAFCQNKLKEVYMFYNNFYSFTGHLQKDINSLKFHVVIKFQDLLMVSDKNFRWIFKFKYTLEKIRGTPSILRKVFIKSNNSNIDLKI